LHVASILAARTMNGHGFRTGKPQIKPANAEIASPSRSMNPTSHACRG
jgi:hypothetical protein